MLELLFALCMLWVLWKIFVFGIKAAWGISKFVITLILFPLILIGAVIGGLLSLAFPIVIIIGILLLFSDKS